jgi:hypothetical protein
MGAEDMRMATSRYSRVLRTIPLLIVVCLVSFPLDPNLPGRKVFDRAVIDPANTGGFGSLLGKPFAGVFDGNGRTISNLTIEGEGAPIVKSNGKSRIVGLDLFRGVCAQFA